jgi:LPS export ABC transporter protein LptC
MANKKIWLNLFFIIISVSGLVIFGISLHQAMDSESKTPVVKDEQPVGGPDELVGMSFRIPGAEKQGFWELQVAQLKNRPAVGIMTTVKGTYFLNKKPLYHLSARTGEILWKTRILTVQDDVKLTTTDGKELRADKLVWNPNEKKIIASSNVVLKTANLTVTSTAISTSLGLDRATFSENTRVLYLR